jgi:hypothetical protein
MPSSTGFYGAYLETIGVEYESIGLSRDTFTGDVLPDLSRWIGDRARFVNLTRDASTEFVAEFVPVNNRGLWISSHTSPMRNLRGIGRGNAITMGYEIYTSPLTPSELESLILPLVGTLMKHGDFVSDRASVHFHIGFANSLNLMKKLLRVVLNVEPILYRLGGMGRTFRGHVNLAAYARPLMQPAAGIVVGNSERESIPDEARRSEEAMRLYLSSLRTARNESRSSMRYAEIINPLAALDAQSLAEFWASFSVAYKPGGGTNKYHGCRYSGTNFYAIPQHGTIEFRHFNQSQNPQLIVAIAKFLRAMVEMSTMLNKQEVGYFQPIHPREELSESDINDIVSNIVALCNNKEVEDIPTDDEVALILETIHESKFEILPEVPVLTHARDFSISNNLVNLGKLNIVPKVLPACNVDIHNIKENSISIFDEFNHRKGK